MLLDEFFLEEIKVGFEEELQAGRRESQGAQRRGWGLYSARQLFVKITDTGLPACRRQRTYPQRTWTIIARRTRLSSSFGRVHNELPVRSCCQMLTAPFPHFYRFILIKNV